MSGDLILNFTVQFFIDLGTLESRYQRNDLSFLDGFSIRVIVETFDVLEGSSRSSSFLIKGERRTVKFPD